MIALLSGIPLLTAAILLFVSSKNEKLLKTLAIAATAIPSALTLALLSGFKPGLAGFQFITAYPWLPQFGIEYKMGLDGINMTLCLLHAIVSLAAVMTACWPKERLKEYLFYFLLLTGAIYGVFTSLNLFFLYLFCEMTLIPVFPMIGIWGSKNKSYGAMQMTLFLSLGAVLALFGILMLYRQAGVNSFDLVTLTEGLRAQGGLGITAQKVIAPFILIGFGIMAALWPFHSWAPIGCSVSPTTLNMLHAGVMEKVGPYLILRIAVAFLPEGVHHAAPWLSVLAAIGILYAGLAAIRQKDMLLMTGFASVSHTGYLMLGLAAMTTVSLSGVVFLMFAHGLMAASAFAVIGFLYERTRIRSLNDFGGLSKQLPFISLCFIITFMAALGLPGFANFVSELLIFIGSWNRFPVIVIIAVIGVLITAIYFLRAIKDVCFGPPNPRWAGIKDAAGFLERFPFVLLLTVLFIYGIWPNGLLRLIEPAVQSMLPLPVAGIAQTFVPAEPTVAP